MVGLHFFSAFVGGGIVLLPGGTTALEVRLEGDLFGDLLSLPLRSPRGKEPLATGQWLKQQLGLKEGRILGVCHNAIATIATYLTLQYAICFQPYHCLALPPPPRG